MMLPRARSLAPLAALVSLLAPSELYVPHHTGTGRLTGKWTADVYAATGAVEKLQRSPTQVPAEKIAG